ncbi:alpha/beta hydrolase [Actinotalea ferrariae]|uniref:alpha/beta fold hydrolase n=1 Tax=Actinotalea ferrariae TaxID=1386098 RepID=UPI001C8C2F01|nr:alpha/beta hydrolase [Actinotalea ferrariae]MBX9245260.1 alpha/beta hydrolase [Actinotalea ferrariae]
MTTTHTLAVPGGTLYYEVRGSGPVLVLTASPMDARIFEPLAELLARDRTVVTHDPRGINRSRLDDPDGPSTPELRADDLAALLDALGAEQADVVGSSGGAVAGLALVARHPGRVRTLVAHEPPLLTLLPDAAEQAAATEALVETFHRDGLGAAMVAFLGQAGWDDGDEAGQGDGALGGDDGGAGPGPGEPSAQDVADGSRFFAHEILPTTRYAPDVAALTDGTARVVVGVGEGSERLVTHPTSWALARLLGTAPISFPGDHHGFATHPEEFAEVLGDLLAHAAV